MQRAPTLGATEPIAQRACDLLEHPLSHANHETLDWVKHDSDLDAIRSHPRYQDVLKLIG